MSIDTVLALSEISRDLHAAVPALETAEKSRVHAEKTYKVAQAKAYLDAEGSVPAREALATIATADLWEAFQVAEAAVRVQREHLKALHARLDVGRSVLAAERQMTAVTA